MSRILYNIFSILIAVALLVFAFYCYNQYTTFGMMISLSYVVISVLSAVAVMLNMVKGVKRVEKERT